MLSDAAEEAGGSRSGGQWNTEPAPAPRVGAALPPERTAPLASEVSVTSAAVMQR